MTKELTVTHPSNEEISLLYTHLLSRVAEQEEILNYEATGTLSLLLQGFLSSEEFFQKNINITEKIDATARFISSYRECDWLSAKVHVTSLYLRHCDWTRFSIEAVDKLLGEQIPDGASDQETRLMVWMVQANELHDKLKKIDATYQGHLDDMAWRYKTTEIVMRELSSKMDRVVQHSAEGDRALLSEILLRLDRIADFSKSEAAD